MRIVPDVVHEQDILRAKAADNARETAKLMADRNVSCVLVVDGAGVLTGIVTERDLTRRFVVGNADLATATVGDIMTPDPETLRPDDSANGALLLMELRNFRHLPVVDDAHKPVAIVSIRDLYASVTAANRDVLAKTQTYVFGERHNPDV